MLTSQIFEVHFRSLGTEEAFCCLSFFLCQAYTFAMEPLITAITLDHGILLSVTANGASVLFCLALWVTFSHYFFVDFLPGNDGIDDLCQRLLC